MGDWGHRLVVALRDGREGWDKLVVESDTSSRLKGCQVQKVQPAFVCDSLVHSRQALRKVMGFLVYTLQVTVGPMNRCTLCSCHWHSVLLREGVKGN